MNASYVHTLSEIETLCGVTLADVARELPRGLFVANGSRFITDGSLSPALAGSVARCAFGGVAIRFVGINVAGLVFERDTR